MRTEFHVRNETHRPEEFEMFRTFNRGVGMVVILSPKSVHSALDLLKRLGQKAWVIGELIQGQNKVLLV
jgi:phosphoribosylformylglycinamidine cyclo-ligase